MSQAHAPLGPLIQAWCSQARVPKAVVEAAATAQAEATAGAAHLARVLGTGLMGGYSTFSTASVEGARLASLGRWRAAAAHGLGMMAACLASGAMGMALGAWLAH